MITGPSPVAARRLLREMLQQAASCVTPSVLIDKNYTVDSELMLFTRLGATSGGGPVNLLIRHFYATVSDASRGSHSRWQALTTGYEYRLDDHDEHEILSYRWHPQERSHVTSPHVHLGAGAGALRQELQKAHLATGLVTPVALLRLLTESFAVRARRSDWAEVLERAESALAEQ
jgi:hypothetical protein